MALDRLRPSLLGVVMVLFGSVSVQVESYQDYVLCDLNTPTKLRVDPASPPFNIKSPGYPKSYYTDLLNCSLVVESVDEPVLLIFSVENFTLEGESTCRFDSLCLAGVKYCGSWESGYVFQKILPSYSTSTIHFKTDGSVTGRGFKITVIPLLLSFGQTVQEVRGNGASFSGVNFTANTFHPWNPYTDQCALPLADHNGLSSLSTNRLSSLTTTRLSSVTTNVPPRFTSNQLHTTTRRLG